MIKVEMADVIAVLQLCKPYIIVIAAAIVLGIIAVICCRKLPKSKKFMVRWQSVVAMVLVIGVCVNMICFGPMSTLIGLAMGDGQLSDETNKETAEVAEDIMEEGIVLLDNEGLLPLTGKTNLNLSI